MNYLVGLTGGIGSGKSTVADMFAELGVRIVDTDQISHQLTQPHGLAIPEIRAAFGAQFINQHGSLDRGRMRELVFAHPSQKALLESILHPLIYEQARQMAVSPSSASYTIVVVPLLFESSRYVGWLQRVIDVDCPEDIQIARTIQRGSLDEAEVRAIMSQQLGREERMRLADDVIDNQGNLDDLKRQVVGIHNRLSVFAAESD